MNTDTGRETPGAFEINGEAWPSKAAWEAAQRSGSGDVEALVLRLRANEVGCTQRCRHNCILLREAADALDRLAKRDARVAALPWKWRQRWPGTESAHIAGHCANDLEAARSGAGEEQHR